jgi:hypothetical protein
MKFLAYYNYPKAPIKDKRYDDWDIEARNSIDAKDKLITRVKEHWVYKDSPNSLTHDFTSRVYGPESKSYLIRVRLQHDI